MRNLFISTAIAIVISTALSGCKPGVQGGDLPSSFEGITTLTAVSPTAVEMSWELNKRYEKYRIYQGLSSTPLKEETFQTSIVKGLSPASTYQFSVTAVDSSGVEKGQGVFTSVQTYSNFQGIRDIDLSLAGPTTVNVNWNSQGANVSYVIYQKVQTGAWNFNQPAYTVNGTGRFQVLNLAEGTPYCFYVVANYKDGTSEPALSTAAADAKSGCITTTSDLTGLPVVSANPALPGAYPWFQSLSGLPEMKTTIYDTDTNLAIATRNGNGAFRAVTPQTPGNHRYHAIVTQTIAGVEKKAKVDLTIKNTAGAKLTQTRIRVLDELYSVTPRLVSGGKGVQRIGAQVVKGDFNCDGIPDLAVSAPKSTPYVHPAHVSEMGAVVIYFGEKYTPQGELYPKYRLKTDVQPSASAVAPNPQLIYYPVDYSNFHFGSKLVAGNFNGDCKKYDPVTPTSSVHADCDTLTKAYAKDSGGNPDMTSLGYIYRCDDIAVAIDPTSGVNAADSKGGVFVLYGDPNTGIVSGSGSANYGKNETTCDPTSGTCRASRYAHTVSTVYHFGKSLGAGDINNDGFDDLLVGGTTQASATSNYGRVTVLRGSSQGLQPTSSSLANQDIQAESVLSTPVAMTSLGAANNSAAPNFAFSLTSVPHSRDCVTITAGTDYRETAPATNVAGFDYTKCADVAIGDPSRGSNRGSVVTCRANFSSAAATPALRRRISGWTCLEHWPNGLETGALYGYSVLGVDNQNGYPLTSPEATSVEMFGALFVGAPYASIADSGASGVNAGKVFGYYAIKSQSATGIQAVMGSGAHDIQAASAIPCNSTNTQNYDSTNSSSRCDHQVIYDAAPQANEHFGWSLGSGAITSLNSTELPKLLVAAPHRDVLGTSSTILDGGAVFIFKGDNSKLGINGTTRTCSGSTASSCTYNLSGGVNPFGPSIVYDKTATNYSNMGLGGLVGDDFQGLTTAREVDVVTSSPDNTLPVEANGSVAMFVANSGFPTTMSSASVLLTTNVSKEINYRFDQAKVIGDVNGDGYQDVIARIKVGSSKVETILFYGSSSGLITTPSPSTTPSGLGPKIIYSSGDKLLGTKFFKAGDINGDGFADVLLIGGDASYIYYGSLTGLITNVEPIVNPVGKNPLKFGLENAAYNAITFHGTKIQGDETQVPPNYDVSLQAVTAGDFNGDGYGDLAIGTNESAILPTGVDQTDTNNANAAATNGRVTIIYGSSRGPQVGSTGYIKRRNSASSTAVADVLAKNPCAAVVSETAQYCSVQQVGPTEATSGRFGFSLATIASMETPTVKADGLVVGDPTDNAGRGAVYYLRGSINGLQVTTTSRQVLHSATATGVNNFGYLVSAPGDINGDTRADLVISAPNNTGSNSAGIYVFYGKNNAGTGQFAGADTIQTTPPAVNARFAATNDPQPQLIMPVDLTTNTTAQFGYGLAGIGDFNGDGLADIAVNVAKGDYELDVKKSQAGYSIIYFGSTLGLRSDLSLSTTPACYGMGTADAVCEPYLFYLPNNAEFENTYLSNSAAGDINGDGYPDVIVGGFGRNHSSGQAFSSGVFYVFY